MIVIMLDVTKEEPEVMDSGSEAIRTERPAGGKPYLKFGVSAILGLDVHPSTQQSQENGSFRSTEESSKLDIKAELFQHHSPASDNETKTTTFHPAYLHSYFHPLIQQAHSAGKHFSGEFFF